MIKKSSNPLINYYNLINVFTYDKYFFSAFLTTPTAFYAVLTCQEMSRPCFLESAKNAFFAFIFPRKCQPALRGLEELPVSYFWCWRMPLNGGYP